ncbi:phage capsid protein [Hypericibacter sp.]|uniref:phage capsid protein n=1 Tax=Hypericibacter sp. TaxID=2705401 RepID=UPI003D6C9B93
MSQAPFPIQPELTGIAIAYKNNRLIADDVLPRVPVGVQQFKWWQYNIAEGFSVPDTKVGRRGAPNEVEFSATEQAGSTSDYGLDDPVPQADIDNAPKGYDPLGRAVEGVTDLIGLDREVRVSGLVFANASYQAANRTTLAGTSQWSDFVNSNPISAIMGALDTLLIRPNTMVLGRSVFTQLAQHPKIVKAVLGNAGDSGVATRENIAQLFELNKVMVGESWLNTAKKGQAATYARVWGKHASLLYIDPLANPQSQSRVTYGYTAQWGTRIAGSMPDSKIGLRGGQRVRVGESVAEVIASIDAGYFFQNTVV